MAQHYFGYGSLVNAATRQPHETAVLATVNGWRRTWQHFFHAPWGPGRSLSIEEAPDARIHGALVPVTEGALARLDEREHGYDRLELDGALIDLPDGMRVDSFFIYRSKSKPPEDGLTRHPITRSYMDCVMQGYRDNFGPDGLQHFLETTTAWNGAVLQDRDAPFYPRAITLRDGEADLFDAMLDKVRA